MNRRRFMKNAMLTGLVYGVGGLPTFINESSAAFQSLGSKRVLLNLMLEGGPDLRHFIVPEYSANTNSFGYHYWRNRTRAHGISNTASAMQNHWNNQFDHRSHNGITFGIAKTCGWFTQMWDAGHVAIINNAYSIDSRAHDHATLVMNQGNRNSEAGQLNRSGWGGRLAVSAGENAIGLTHIPSRFCFGPDGSNINAVDNSHLISVANSRSIGFHEFNHAENARYERRQDQAARAAKSYYKSLHAQLPNDSIYQRFLEHETKIRYFGDLIQQRLATVPIPPRIEALYESNVVGINNPSALLFRRNFGEQIRNAYDTLASHDLLDARVLSMELSGWDTHGDQAEDINENLEDVFGADKGLSALWQALELDAGTNVNRENLVMLIAGEFGRQLRDNGGNGTDHGEGNMMFMIGEKVTGGLYGDLFPEAEIDRIQDQDISTPDILGLTQIDQHFGSLCDWVVSGSSGVVFPDRANAQIEQVGMFSNLFHV
ncbi:MAG: DUF1501 domain-containing protein [Arenicellales bacterium]